MAGKWLILARWFLASSTEGFAGKPVHHPSWEYEGRVLSFGTISRSIPTPAGMPQTGNARVRMADTDRRLRNLLASQTPRQKMMELKLVEEGASESAAAPLYVGAVVDVEFGPGYLEAELADQSLMWLDEEIPGFINNQNFSNLAEDGKDGFLPIIAGVNIPLRLPHIGYEAGVGDRWGVASHPVYQVRRVERKEEDSAGAVIWAEVNPAEYSVNKITRTFVEVPSLEFNPTFLDFAVEQPEGTEIRAYVDGMDFRGGWEGIPPAGYHPDHNPTGVPGPLRNPADVFINLIYLMMAKAGTTAASWDVESIAAVLQRFAGLEASESYFAAELGMLELGHAELGDGGVSAGFPPFLCDGALVEPMTVRAFLGRFLTSFELDLYPRKDGRLALKYTEDTDPLRPGFDDVRHILRNTFYESLAKPTFNRMTFRYQANYATGNWEQSQIHDNSDDQNVLDTIEEDFFDIWWVRDPQTAAYVSARRLSFFALGAYRQTFTLPLPEVFADIELAKLVGITHWAGADYEGYLAKEVKITALSMNLSQLTVTVESILREPQLLVAPPIDPEELFCDSFNRAYAGADNLGANWTVNYKAGATFGQRVEARLENNHLTFGFNGNSNQPTNVGDGSVAIPIPDQAALEGLHQYCEVKMFSHSLAGFGAGDIQAGPSAMWRGLLSATTAGCYCVQFRLRSAGHTIRLIRVLDNVITELMAPIAFSYASGDTLRIGALPGSSLNRIRVWKNDVLIFEFDDDSPERLTPEGYPTVYCKNIVAFAGSSDLLYLEDFCAGLGWGPPIPPPAPGEAIADDFNRAADSDSLEGEPASGGFNWITPLRADGVFAPWKIRPGAIVTSRVLQATSGSTDPINYRVNEDYCFLTMADDASVTDPDQWAEMVYDSEANPLYGDFASGPAVRVSGPTFPDCTGYGLVFRRAPLANGRPVWYLELIYAFREIGVEAIRQTVLASVELGREVSPSVLERGDVLRIEVEGSSLRGYINGTERLTATHATLTTGRVGKVINVRGQRVAWAKWKLWQGGEL